MNLLSISVANRALAGAVTSTPTPTPPPTAIVAISFGDSTWEGVIGPREAGDTDWPGVYEVKVDNSLSSDITPMRRFAGPADSLCPQEYWGKERNADTGLPVYMVQSAVGGAGLTGTAGWAAPSGTNLVNAVARANAAIQAVIASVGGPVQVEFTGDIGTNDGGVSMAAYAALLDGMIEYFRNNVYKNGVSGATCTDSTFGFVVPQPEWACITDEHRTIALESRRAAGTKSNCVVYSPPNGQTVGDNLHPTLVGARANGVGLANAFAETVAPTITFADFTIYSGQKLAREITADKIAWFTLSGADAAQFEIAEIAASTAFGGGDVNAAQTKFYLRWAGNGDAPAAGTYNVTINAKGNAATIGTKAVVVTVAAAYGTQTETIVASFVAAQQTSTNGTTRRVFTSFALKRGVNMIAMSQTAGSGVSYVSVVASNGLVGTADANNSGTNGTFYIYSAQDETVDLIVTTVGNFGDLFACGFNAVGTTATPTATAIAGFTGGSSSGSLACPTNGIIIGGGISTNGYSPTSGQTNLTNPSALPVWGGYRTTTGALTNGGGAASAHASAWAKA